MDNKVFQLLNDQINKELYSAYLYLDMANFYSSKGLDGFANWYEIQAKEEQDHAMLMYRYLHNNGQGVTLEAVAKPDKEFKDLSDPLKAAYEHEQYVTGHLRRRPGGSRLSHRPVFGLVCEGAGGRGEERLRPHHQDGAVRRRRQGPVHAQQRVGRAGVLRAVAGAVRSAEERPSAPAASQRDR